MGKSSLKFTVVLEVTTGASFTSINLGVHTRAQQHTLTHTYTPLRELRATKVSNMDTHLLNKDGKRVGHAGCAKVGGPDLKVPGVRLLWILEVRHTVNNNPSINTRQRFNNFEGN